jgi:hypothetical protein
MKLDVVFYSIYYSYLRAAEEIPGKYSVTKTSINIPLYWENNQVTIQKEAQNKISVIQSTLFKEATFWVKEKMVF